MGNLLASLYTGNTGLHTASIGVSVVGDNIANSNTVGFKASRAHFQDLLSQSIIGASGQNQVGKGSMLERIEKLFTQGVPQPTGVPTDLAINGDGFFILSGQQAGTSEQFYTRAGSFRFDDDAHLVSQGGLRVQGYAADASGTLGSALGDVRITQQNLVPQASTALELNANLQPDAPLVGPFDPADPDSTSNYRVEVGVRDSLGNLHQVEVYGTRTAEGVWSFSALVDAEALGGQPGQVEVRDIGELTFDDQGRLLEERTLPLDLPWANGAAASSITVDFGDSMLTDGGTGRAGTTQWNDVTDSETTNWSVDGYGTGQLETVAIDEHGVISGGYTNGRTMVLGQVAMARFEDPTGLSAKGGNLFADTADSGEALIGAAGTAGRGAILSGYLEQSNVEISDQFIDLIAYQRSYQANSRTITSADGLLQEVLSLLR